MRITKKQLQGIIDTSLNEDTEKYQSAELSIPNCYLDPRYVTDSFLSVWFGDQLLQNSNNFSVGNIAAGLQGLKSSVITEQGIIKMVTNKLGRYQSDANYRKVVDQNIKNPNQVITSGTGSNIRYLLEVALSYGPLSLFASWICSNLGIAARVFQTMSSTIPALAPFIVGGAFVGAAGLAVSKFKKDKLTNAIDKCLQKVGADYKVSSASTSRLAGFFVNTQNIDMGFDDSIYFLFPKTTAGMSSNNLTPEMVAEDLQVLKKKLKSIQTIPKTEEYFKAYFEIVFKDNATNSTDHAQSICQPELKEIASVIKKIKPGMYGKSINNLLKHFGSISHTARDIIQETIEASIKSLSDKASEEQEVWYKKNDEDDSEEVDDKKEKTEKVKSSPEQVKMLYDFHNVFKINRLATKLNV